MNLTAIKVADVVECDVRGDRFFAKVDTKHSGQLEVRPLHGAYGVIRIVRARQVVGHYRKSKASR